MKGQNDMTSNPSAPVTLKLTEFDKLALLAQFSSDDDLDVSEESKELEEQITQYSAELYNSPVMLRFLRDTVSSIQHEESNGEDGASILALKLAELHFASQMSLAC